MADQPNLLFIMPDQLRPDFLSCYGVTFIDTPHIDDLAAQGIRYERAYSTSPICVPARASLLTGLAAIKNGVTDNSNWLRTDLAQLGIHTWPELLAARGHYTAAIGKMHFYPWDARHGFQYRVIAEDKRWLNIRDDYYRFLHSHGYRKYHGNEHPGYHENKGAIINRIPWAYSVDHFVGQAACEFIRDYADEGPFAMMVGFPGPHCPYDPTPEYLADFDPAAMPDPIPEAPGNAPELRRQNIAGNRRAWNGVDYSEFTLAQKRIVRAHYAALVKQIDDEIGSILETLREKDLLNNTLIIFASDHGDYLGDHNLIGKGTFYEGSIHVPLIVRPTGGSEPVVRSDLVALGDVTATLLAAGGADLPAYLDSIPLPGLGLPGQQERNYLVGMVSGGWMLYDGRWKLAKYATGEVLLFDLTNDPHEQRNLTGDLAHHTKYLELDRRLTQAIMQSLVTSHREKRVDLGEGWADVEFGKEGWQRPYPYPLSGS